MTLSLTIPCRADEPDLGSTLESLFDGLSLPATSGRLCPGAAHLHQWGRPGPGLS